MKKIFIILLSTLTLLLGFSTVSFAISDASQEVNNLQIQDYAYMELESASTELKSKIIEARNTIINSESWVADGYDMYIIDIDGSQKAVPHFSELFPSDWELPDCATEENSNVLPTAVSEPIDPLNTKSYTISSVSLKNPSSNILTSPFYTFYFTGTSVMTKVEKLTTSETCNIGYTNLDTGKSLGFATKLTAGQKAQFVKKYEQLSNFYNCGVRASTYSSPGTGKFNVTYDYSITV